MKTADLIAALGEATRDEGAAPATPLTGMLVIAAMAGAGVALALLVGWLGLRPIPQAERDPAFWMKAAYTLGLGLTGFLLVRRLARPGGRIGWVPLLAAAAIVLLAMRAAIEMGHASPGALRPLVIGSTWRVCSGRILALAVPVFIAAVLVLRRLAPTRLTLAGAAAGLLAGGVAASVYGLYCQETAAPFVLVWYSLGIGACAVVGAFLGSRLLRW